METPGWAPLDGGVALQLVSGQFPSMEPALKELKLSQAPITRQDPANFTAEASTPHLIFLKQIFTQCSRHSNPTKLEKPTKSSCRTGSTLRRELSLQRKTTGSSRFLREPQQQRRRVSWRNLSALMEF
ncbi:hypothetical protein AOLI_G00004590 [Acnodon oligacanthus]